MVEFNPFSSGYKTMKMTRLRSRKEVVLWVWGRGGLASAFSQGTPLGLEVTHSLATVQHAELGPRSRGLDVSKESKSGHLGNAWLY